MELDHIARAIHEATSAGQLFPWDELEDANKETLRRMAQAAVAAMEA